LKRLNSKSKEDERNYIRKKNEIRRTVNTEKDKMRNNKCTGMSEEDGAKKHGNSLGTTTEKRQTVPIPIISHKE